MPEVSVITPLFNSEFFIKKTISSVQSQTFSDWEMIIVDDCSTDGGVAIVEEIAEVDKRIKLIRLNNNCGAAVARNTAIDSATGRYLAFLDADDLWLPEKLDKQIEFMKLNGFLFTHTWYQPVNVHGDKKGGVVKPPYELEYKDMLFSNQIGCLTAIYDSHYFGKVHMPLLKKRQDYALWLKLLKSTKAVYCYPESLSLYRSVSSSVSSNKVEMIAYNWRMYREIEGLSFSLSFYYLFWNVIRKICK